MAKKLSRGLILSGGGARAAYQAGVLRHCAEISREPGGKVPFEILVGTSAGAINLAAIAAGAADFQAASRVMTERWGTIATAKVFETGAMNFGVNALRWFLDLTFGGAVETNEPRAKSLVDTAPLGALIRELLPERAVEDHIRQGVIDAVAVSATDYRTKALTVFVEARKDRTLWRRYSRVARYDRITPAHILASCALPILFPAVKIGASYFGDGSIRNTAPLSPAIHLGARKILAIGVREQTAVSVDPAAGEEGMGYPSPARISGVLLDSIFLDALEIDREQMVRINRLLEDMPEGVTDQRGARLHPIDFLYLGPSRDLSDLAIQHRHEIPRSVRYMLSGLGAKGTQGGELLSYLSFESGYCRELMDLGHADAKARSDEISAFLWG